MLTKNQILTLDNLLIVIFTIATVNCNDYSELECNFDQDKCHWTDSNDAWLIGNPSSLHHHGFTWTPIQGDRFSSPNGSYLYMNPLSPATYTVNDAILSSEQLTDDQLCLTFWYYMFGLEPGKLYIEITYPNSSITESIVWQRESNHGRQWIKSSVSLISIYSDLTWVISFHGKYASQYSTDEIIAIDDIQMVQGKCSTDELCDFESTLDNCNLHTVSAGKSSWGVTIASFLNTSLILVDHTTFTSRGNLAYVEGIKAKDVAIMSTVNFHHAGKRCLKFWYTSTTDDAQFEVHQIGSNGQSLKLWSRNRNHRGEWRRGVVNLRQMSSYSISFRVEFYSSNAGYYAMDDISFQIGSCSHPVNCDFADDACQWTNTDSTETFDWIRMNGQLLGSSLAGPGQIDDEKDENDFYLYAYFDSTLSLKSAIVDSGDFNLVSGEDNFCLMFNVYAVNGPKLELVIEMLQNGDELKPVLIVQNDTFINSGWKRVKATIKVNQTGSENDFQFLRFHANYISEEEDSGDDGMPKPHPFASIAVDDIEIAMGTCDQPKPSTEEPSTTLNPLDMINDFTCDFEKDLCNLFNVNHSADSLWYRRTSARVKSDSSNLPSVDHTLDLPKGHFVYSQVPKKPTSDKQIVSELSTSTIKALGSIDGACLTFWYYIRGTQLTSLSLQMVRSDDLLTKTIWRRSNLFADHWDYGYVNIKPVAYDFTIKFIANHSNDIDSGIALDDVSYSTGLCSTGMIDSLCDFEQGLCGFDNGNVQDEIWRLTNGSSVDSIGVDYSTQTGSGSFLIASYNHSSSSDLDSTGYLIHDEFIESEYNCIQFAVNVKDGHFSFIISTHVKDQFLSSNTLWSVNNTSGWTLIRLPLTLPGQAKVISFHFIGSGYAAIDDVKLLTECQPLGYCNFEIDNCGWQATSANSLDYLSFHRGHGRNSMDGYSPSYDMTTKKGSGFYSIVSFDAKSSKRYSNEQYNLISPLISSPTIQSNYCLSFWHYENGQNKLPSLHIVQNQFKPKGQIEAIYLDTIKVSKPSNIWSRKSYQIDNLDGLPFTIEFRAFANTFPSLRPSVIAIDDIELYSGLCKDSIEVKDETTFECGIVNYTGRQLCDFNPDCKDASDESLCGYDCDFEKSSCGWTVGPKSDSKLMITSLGMTKGANPNIDSTYNTDGKGSYLKLITKLAKKLTYLSPVMKNSGENCYINLSLYMSIDDSQRSKLKSIDYSRLTHLTISLIDLRSTETTVIHNIVNDLGKKWHSLRLYIGRIVSDFQIQLEVYANKKSDVIAIDDIRADPDCAIPRISDSTSCSADQFYCPRMKRCIDASFICDFSDDCGDGEDEDDTLAQCTQRPGRCDFEQSTFCDWSDDGKWEIVHYNDLIDDKSMSVDERLAVPTRDHTINSVLGRFAVNRRSDDGSNHSMISPSLFRPDAQSICSLTFYHQLSDPQSIIKTLNPSIPSLESSQLGVQIVLPHLTDSHHTLESIIESVSLSSPYFKKITINVGPEVVTHNRLFQLGLLPIYSANSSAIWAIDDVSFNSDCVLADCYLQCRSNDGSSPICVSLAHKCDFIVDCADELDNGKDEINCTSASCSFSEADTCHWDIKETDGSLTWKLYQPLSDPINQPEFMPKYDATHHDPSGWFLLFDSRDSSTAGQAQLWSQMIGQTSAQCSLMFNYFCPLDQCDLTIYLETDLERSGNSFKRLWVPHQLSSNNHDFTAQWRSGIAFIGHVKYGRILITVSKDFNEEQFAVGLDDLNFIDCSPPQPSTSTSGCDPSTSFQCSNDNCIDKWSQCDFVDDCLDGSDETEACSTLPGRCDIETSCTFWKPDSYRVDRFSSISWAQTPDLPSFDHTTGLSSGTYLSLSGSQKSVEVWARHYSQIIDGSKSTDCNLNLWVNIIDYSSTSKLVISQRFNYSANGYRVVARIAPNFLGDYWKKYNIKLPESQANYQIVLEGFIAVSNDASINIDDITLTTGCSIAPNDTILPGKEEDEPTTTQPTTTEHLIDCDYGYKPCSSVTKCYPTESECDFKDDCGDGTDEANCPSSCTFENGWCNWVDLSDSVNGHWLIQEASESDIVISDHTKGDKSGSYALALFNENVSNGLVTLNSPNFTSSGARCTFSFSYYMPSDGPKFKVRINHPKSGLSRLIYSIEGGHSPSWYLGYVNIGSNEEPFSIAIDAVRVDEHSDSIQAIDDIAFEQCGSTDSKIMEDCPKNQWECQSKCLPIYQLCDGFSDCSDGQDEVDCPTVKGNCDFDEKWRDHCDWTENDITAKFCSPIEISKVDSSISLKSDHTLPCAMALASPLFPAMVDDICHFTFQFKIKMASGEAYIKIVTLTDESYTELTRFRSNQLDRDWTTYHVTLNNSRPYHVHLVLSVEADSEINLRSFRFSPNCQTGQQLTIEDYPNKIEPWESRTTKITTTSTEPTTETSTTRPTTRPTKPTTTKKPSSWCNCDNEKHRQTKECQDICEKSPTISPILDNNGHSSSSILYLSFGIVGILIVAIVLIYTMLPIIYRRFNYRSDGYILDDRFPNAHYDVVDADHPNNDQNVFGLLETKFQFRNSDDAL